ncbi:MAG: PAS domain S-box protein [Candidatus Methanofastidiosum sp.]|nr:PAS domain S-box protein [Methanofastidiosum sp.]
MDKLLNSKKEEYLNNISEIYRKIFENSFDAILLVDDKSRFVDANLSAFNLLGYTKSELINMGVEDLTPKEYIEHGKKLREEFLEKGNQKGEYILLKKDKEEINVEYRGFANIVPGLHLFIIKDTNSKKLNKVLKDREKTLQGIFTASPVGINLIQNRKFIWSNEMMSQITGYPLNEIIDKNTKFLYISDEDYEKAGYDYNKKLAEGKWQKLKQDGDEKMGK